MIKANLANLLEPWFSQVYLNGRIPGLIVQDFIQRNNLLIEDLMVGLLPFATRYSQAEISHFPVGAVLLGESGSLYLGANYEFPGNHLALSIHAEQAAVINARCHQESGIVKMALTHYPCGFCRQFLQEVCDPLKLTFILKDQKDLSLQKLLPMAFSAIDMRVDADFWNPGKKSLLIDVANPLELAAIQAAQISYAPYTHAYAGIAVELKNGEIYSSCYLENAAFNPSVLSISSVCSVLATRGISLEQIENVCLMQCADSVIDQVNCTQAVMMSNVPGAKLYVKLCQQQFPP